MPLSYQTIKVPIVGGMNEKLDPKSGIAPISLKNVRYTKTGRLQTRPGIECLYTSTTNRNKRLGYTYADAENPRLLFPFRDALYRAGGGYLDEVLAYSASYGLVPRGRISECTVRLREINSNTVAQPSVCITSAYTFVAYTTVDSSSGTPDTSIYAEVFDNTTGGRVSGPSKLYGTSGGNWPEGATLVTDGTNVVCALFRPGVGTLRLFTYSTSTLTWTDNAGPAVTGFAWDICADSSRLYIVYASGGHIKCDTSSLSTISLTTTTLVNNGAAAFTAYNFGCSVAAGGRLHWAYVDVTGGTMTAAAYAFTAVASPASVWGPTTIYTGTSASAGRFHIGCVNAASNAAWWVLYDDDTSTIDDVMRWNHTNASGTATFGTTARKIVKCIPISRPFIQNSRCYVAACTFNHDYGTNVLLELASTSDSWQYHIAAVWDPATVLPQDVYQILATDLYHATLPAVANTATDEWIIPTLAGDYGPADASGSLTYRAQTLSLAKVTFNPSLSAADEAEYTIISGGAPSYHDGGACTEVGFLYPPGSDINSISAGGSGSSTYQYAFCYAWTDATGNVHRSPVSTTESQTRNGTGNPITVTVQACNLSNKVKALSGARQIMVEIYRSLAGGSTLYLADTVVNDEAAASVTWTDTKSDSDISSNRTIYTTGGVKPFQTPPSAGHVCRWQDRFVLTDTPANEVWVSGPIVDGECPQFHLDFVIPRFTGERIIAAAELDEKLVLFAENAIYFTFGTGPDSAGNGALPLPRSIASDVGCIDARSITLLPDGLAFQSQSGISVLTRGLQVVDISDQIEDTAGQTLATPSAIRASVNCPEWKETRFVVGTSETRRCVVLDRIHGNVQQPCWYYYEYANPAGSSTAEIQSACHYDGGFTFITTDGYVYEEDKTDYLDSAGGTSTWVTPRIELANWHGDGSQKTYVIGAVGILAERATDHDLSVSVYADWATSATKTASWTRAEIAALDREQVLVTWPSGTVPPQAARVVVTSSTPTGGTVGTGQGFYLSALVLEVAEQKPTLVSRPVGAKK